MARICPSPEAADWRKLLHRLAHFAAHHALQFGDGAFHHAGEIFQGAANGDLGFHRFELALESLNLAKTFSDDRRVLFVELLQTVGLALVFVEVRFEGGQFFGVMRAVGIVVGCSGGLEQALQFFALAVLPFDLVLQQRNLSG